MQLIYTVLISGYDEWSPPCVYMHWSRSNHAGPLQVHQLEVPHHMHTPVDQLEHIMWSMVILNQSVTDMSKWYSCMDTPWLSQNCMVGSEWKSSQTELVSCSIYNNHHLHLMALGIVGPL